jgi:hypothetical protein
MPPPLFDPVWTVPVDRSPLIAPEPALDPLPRKSSVPFAA